MTYNYFNELKRSFEKRAFVYSDGYDDKKKKKEEKEASYLGRRAMEKSGQRAISNWFGEGAAAKGGLRQAIGSIPAAGAATAAGYGISEGTNSPIIGALGGIGTYGLLSPGAIAKMNAASRSAAAKQYRIPKGTTLDQAFDQNLTRGMSPEALTRAGLPDELMKGFGNKAKLMLLGAAGEYGPAIARDFGGWNENLAEQTALPDDYQVTSEDDDDWSISVNANRVAMAQQAAGLDPDTAKATEESATQADKVWLASKGGQYMVKQYKLPPGQRSLRIKRTPSTSTTFRNVAQEAEGLTEDVASAANVAEEAAQPFVDTIAGVGQSIGQTAESGKGMTDEMAAIRESIGRGLSKAAPVGAGALGGYILSSLLGPGVEQDETPSERERRERLQRIYNLVGTTGGGALGYFLANRLGGGDDAKTASELGRAAAQQFSY
jgi:hypothetical protein